MLFDTHAHYDAEQFDQDREAVLAGLPSRDVSFVVNPGCDIRFFEDCYNIKAVAEKYHGALMTEKNGRQYYLSVLLNISPCNS